MINKKLYSTTILYFKMIIIIICITLSGVNAYAKDLGVIGKVYPINETDLLEFIKQKILSMQQNGEWQKRQVQWKARVADHIDRPLAVNNINKTSTAKTWRYDPSITVPYDVKDHNGQIIAKAGTRINPLSIKNLHTALVFYDADDEEQVEWVKKINKKYAEKTKLILVKGSISHQEKIFHQPIYFDQQGKLTANFHITQVPAVVYQDGMELVIAEIIP